MKTLAILAPNKITYSETFIQSHKTLPFNIRYYYDGFLPTQLESKGKVTKYGRIGRWKNRFSPGGFSMPERGLMDSLKTEKVDCVLAEYGPTASLIVKIVKELKIPMIAYFYGFDATHNETIDTYREGYQEVFDYAVTIMVVSRVMKNDLVKLGCPESKIVVNYCGPNSMYYDAIPKFDQPVFIGVGRFVNKKAPYLTICAFKKVLDQFPQTRLIMVGDGMLLNTCKNLVEVFNIQNNVEFAGIKSQAELLMMFQHAIAFVQHSIIAADGDSEGTPVAILDAQAAGLPVVSTRHAGIPEVIIENETGLLSDEKDVNDMAENMKRLLQEPGLARQMGLKGRQNVQKHFSMEKHLEILTEYISKAIQNK